VTDGARTVLDASAVLAWMHDEAGAEVIDPFIGPGSVVCAVNWGEVLYKLAEVGAGEASDLMVVTGDSYWAALGSGLEIVDYHVGSSA
jgi:hypothetical protein